MNKKIMVIGFILIFLIIFIPVAGSHSFDKKLRIKSDLSLAQHLMVQGGWPQIYCGGSQDNALDIAIDSNDNVIVTGFSALGSFCDAYTIKYDSEGNEIWNASFDSGVNDVGFCSAIDMDDNILVFGYSGNLPISEGSCFLVKYSSDGLEQWNFTLDQGACDYPGGLAVDNENNIIVTGGSGVWQMNIFYWIIKMDENGVELWNHSFHEAALDIGLGVAVDSQSDIITIGVSSTFFVDPIFIIKYNPNGAIIWEKRRPGAQPWDVAIDSQDNIILTGASYSQTVDLLTMKCDRDGALLWMNDFDSGTYDGGQSVAVDSKNNIIIGGYSEYSVSDNLEHCSILYDSGGNELCIKRLGIEGLIYGVAVNSSDVIYITGVIEENIWGYYTTKFSDTVAPEVDLIKPKFNYLHVSGKPIVSLPKRTIILGKLLVAIESEYPADIEYIEIFINNKLEKTLNSSPYEWTWDEMVFGYQIIDVFVYDSSGCACHIEREFWKFF